MTKATFEVGGLISMLDYLGVEKRLRTIPGVADVVMNPGGETATIAFDESRTDAEAIRRAIQDCGFHCRGEMVPRHVCVPDSTTIAPSHPPAAHDGHAHHARTDVTAAPPTAHAGHDAAAAAPRPAPAHDMMAHEMGHCTGMDMQAMVRDMRNRFLGGSCTASGGEH